MRAHGTKQPGLEPHHQTHAQARSEHIPSESSLLRFRHLLERHKLAEQIQATVNALPQARGLQLKAGTVVDATLIAAPSSTKNASGDADSGLVHTVRGTSGNVHDVIEANSLLHGQEIDAFADAGYQGVDKRPDAKSGVRWHVAMCPWFAQSAGQGPAR